MRIRGALVQIGPHRIDRDRWDWDAVDAQSVLLPRPGHGGAWEAYLSEVRKAGSSAGAVIEVVAEGVPPGLGAPIYGKLDAEIAAALMSINAVKGVEIGDGFAAAALSGEANADEMRMRDGVVEFASNHAGGILGGISTGQPIVARFAVKPTSSILTPRQTVDRTGQDIEISTKGRHDPCVGIRAVPVGEAMLACVLADHLLRHRAQNPDAPDHRAAAAQLRRGNEARGGWRLFRRDPAAMQPQPPPYDPLALDAFVALAGTRVWAARMAEIASTRRVRTACRTVVAPASCARAGDRTVAGHADPAAVAGELHAAQLAGAGGGCCHKSERARQGATARRCDVCSAGDCTLVPLFHLLRTAALQASRGFTVDVPRPRGGAPYDLLIARGGSEAEVACEVVSAEEGRLVGRQAWSQLADRVDADVRAWLADRPGRYLLKMSLPRGLQSEALADDACTHPPPAGD